MDTLRDKKVLDEMIKKKNPLGLNNAKNCYFWGGSGYLASILRDLNSIKNKVFFFSRRKNFKNDIKYYSTK